MRIFDSFALAAFCSQVMEKLAQTAIVTKNVGNTARHSGR
jgi:hypothetical protein